MGKGWEEEGEGGSGKGKRGIGEGKREGREGKRGGRERGRRREREGGGVCIIGVGEIDAPATRILSIASSLRLSGLTRKNSK